MPACDRERRWARNRIIPRVPLAARYARIPADLFEGFDYTADALAEGRGGFFPALKADIGSYVHARPWLRRWLGNLRSGGGQGRGPRVFLATNSHADFADLLLRHTFGDDWATAMADVLIVNCQKPAWFRPTPSTADAAADGDDPRNRHHFVCWGTLAGALTLRPRMIGGASSSAATRRSGIAPGCTNDHCRFARALCAQRSSKTRTQLLTRLSL